MQLSYSLPLVALALAMTNPIHALPSFVPRIPNGGGVAGVPALGHADKIGESGDLDAFGLAFKAAGNKWTAALCKADSDGDGQTNGEELGDPCCVWSPGATPKFSAGVSSPGDASSTVSATVLSSNPCNASPPATTTPPKTTAPPTPPANASPATPPSGPATTTAVPAMTTARPTTTTNAPSSTPATKTPSTTTTTPSTEPNPTTADPSTTTETPHENHDSHDEYDHDTSSLGEEAGSEDTSIDEYGSSSRADPSDEVLNATAAPTSKTPVPATTSSAATVGSSALAITCAMVAAMIGSRP